MNFLFDIIGITSLVNDFNSNISRLGWTKANKKFIKDLKLEVKKTTRGFPKKGPVIVYSNHPTGLDPYLVSSVLQRDDLYFLSDIYQTRKGKAVAAHIIPVYYDSWFEAFKRSGIGIIGFLFMRLASPTVSPKFAASQNSRALDQAIARLKNGSCLLIFPSGGEKPGGRWKKGIGEIINRASQQKIPFVLYKCKISNFGEPALLGHMLFGRLLNRQATLNIAGQKVSFQNLRSNNDPIAITTYLQTEYENSKI